MKLSVCKFTVYDIVYCQNTQGYYYKWRQAIKGGISGGSYLEHNLLLRGGGSLQLLLDKPAQVSILVLHHHHHHATAVPVSRVAEPPYFGGSGSALKEVAE